MNLGRVWAIFLRYFYSFAKLDQLADLAHSEDLWFHVDGAFGALAALAPRLRPLIKGLERADSIAFDFHKWLHVPYDAGCVIIKDEAAHRGAFSARREYLESTETGLAGGAPWFCDYGPELSRGFRALKVWFTIKSYGIRKLAAMIEQNCAQAKKLEALVLAAPAEHRVPAHAEFARHVDAVDRDQRGDRHGLRGEAGDRTADAAGQH